MHYDLSLMINFEEGIYSVVLHFPDNMDTDYISLLTPYLYFRCSRMYTFSSQCVHRHQLENNRRNPEGCSTLPTLVKVTGKYFEAMNEKMRGNGNTYPEGTLYMLIFTNYQAQNEDFSVMVRELDECPNKGIKNSIF